ncbi:MAG TPA: hypothetical protein VFY67_02480 [Pyrinomonadaceae bacterium]|nr:hypothetical protein [Pyrinomonadaceae bacterium]
MATCSCASVQLRASVVRSMKFFVAEPVPPLATGTTPVSEMFGVLM